MQSISERDRPGSSSDLNMKMSLGDAIQKERKLVILGDPGSGKTTLARWLALKSAIAMQKGQQFLTVPAHQVDPNAEMYLIPLCHLHHKVMMKKLTLDRPSCLFFFTFPNTAKHGSNTQTWSIF